MIDKLLNEVKEEMNRGVQMYGDFNSYHEGYAVIKEELDELWEEIKKRNPSKYNLKEEAIQLTAMGLKFLLMLEEK